MSDITTQAIEKGVNYLTIACLFYVLERVPY
jgi:hypothetical protein